nr:hypothetical protein CFP56_24923 [Quercus suber]
MDIDATDRDRNCFLCAEIPHNEVRLDCRRRQDGNKFQIPACRTFVCAYPNTKGRKNCVTQFLSNTGAKDYCSFVRWNDSLRTLEYLDERKPESSNWIVGKCPICQGHIRGVEVIDNVRLYSMHNNRYLGIQYINYRDMKIVWVANRQNSLMDSSGVPSINGEEIVWQSFDFPSDTILPGMKLGLFDTSQDSIRIWIGMNPSGQIDMFIVGLDGSSALWSQSSCDDE